MADDSESVTRPGSPKPGTGDPEATRLNPAPPDVDVTRAIEAPRAPQPAADDDETKTGATPAPAARPAGEGGNALDLVGRSLGTRYQILKLLGAGGMGAVYQAWDQELNVVVALKTVRPELAADADAARELDRRFKQELLLARQVTHRNIVRVHDMGEVNGLKYITMPFLEGEDLSTILKREGRLPVERVMTIARQVASGLAAAHEAGVVHRDLKPANIMIEAGGEALITDFGVARSTGSRASVSDQTGRGSATAAADQTTMGTVVGTVEYMAPEQARAEPVDRRADIYSFGLILYDLLLGRTRVSKTERTIDELTRRMREPPPAPRIKDPSIPEAVNAIVARCIQTDPAARFQTTADLVAAIDRLDDHGVPIPLVRRLTWRMAAVAAVAVTGLLVGTWWLASGPAVPVEHEPVSVLIADFQNTTGDATFDGTLEPVMRLALEGAGFISAYDRAGIRRSLGVPPPETMPEQTALELAVKQGVNYVLSGTVAKQGARYDVSVRAIQAVTGTVITTVSNRASRQEDVLGVATSLAGSVREALGDTTGDAGRRFGMETLSSTSIEAVREYAKGMVALSNRKFDDALKRFAAAIALDPTFGVAYGASSIAAWNLDRQQDAVKFADEAMKHLDGMTDRERFRTRGMYYSITDDYEACVKEYGALIAKYAADAAARNNRAFCLVFLRDLSGAVAEMRQVVKILPNRPLYRENLALYTAYSGDFQGAETQVQEMQDPGLFALMAKAFAQLGQGRLADAARTYGSLGVVDKEEGPSYAASGVGDLAIHEGRYADAVRILTLAAGADLTAKSPDRAARKFLALAYAQLTRGQKAAAIDAAERALSLSPAPKIQFLAGRIFIEAGAAAKGEQIATALAGGLKKEPQAYGTILEGLRAMSAGNHRLAVKHFTDANAVLDTWFGHYDLGRAYLAAGALPQADSEFDRCFTRKGEALSILLDDEPTFGYFPTVLYYQGRVREGLKSTSFADSYRAYLQIRGTSTEDPLVADAKKRAR